MHHSWYIATLILKGIAFKIKQQVCRTQTSNLNLGRIINSELNIEFI